MPDWLKDALPLLSPVVVVVAAWALNARAERKARRRHLKEERYLALLRALRGLYETSGDAAKREEFLTELTLCWAYAPDSVIKAAYTLVDAIKDGRSGDSSLEDLAGELVSVVRKDVLSDQETEDSTLTGKDFLHLGAPKI